MPSERTPSRCHPRHDARRRWAAAAALALGAALAATAPAGADDGAPAGRGALVESHLPMPEPRVTPRRAARRGGDLRPRIYTVMPSSEPDSIFGPSDVKVFDPGSYEVSEQVPVRGLKPHHFYPVPGRNFALLAHFRPTAYVEVFDMAANEIVGTIPTGLGPRHHTFKPNGSLVYTANFDGDSISVINVASRTTIATVPVGRRPNYVAYVKTRNGPRLFVCNLGENTLTVLDADTLERITTITVGNAPFNMAVTADQRVLMSANAGDNTVSFVDTDTLQVTDTVSIGGDHDPAITDTLRQRLNPRISPDGKWLWVGNHDASVMSIVNIPERRLERLIPAGKGADIAFFPAGGPARGYALITNRYDDFVTVARLNGDDPPTFVKNVPHSTIGSHYITFNEDFSKAYVSQRPGRAFSVLDMATMTNERDSVPVGPGGEGAAPNQAGPDQAFYVWFENGRARFHPEHADR